MGPSTFRVQPQGVHKVQPTRTSRAQRGSSNLDLRPSAHSHRGFTRFNQLGPPGHNEVQLTGAFDLSAASCRRQVTSEKNRSPKLNSLNENTTTLTTVQYPRRHCFFVPRYLDLWPFDPKIYMSALVILAASVFWDIVRIIRQKQKRRSKP